MNVVIVVGAGATLAEALPSHPPRSRRPPLDTTFFQLCRLAGLEGRAAVRGFLQDSFGIDPFSGEHRMEEVFNYLYSQAFAQNPEPQCLEAYWALIRMYWLALTRTTNGLRGNSRYGVGAVLRHIWRTYRGCRMTFITFNQDLVIEKALTKAVETWRYSGIPWSIFSCYEVPFAEFVIDPNERRRVFPGRRNEDSVKVLKLHGSLNWVYTVRSGQDPKNSLRHPRTPLRCVVNQRVRADRRVTVRSTSRDLVPLIVPPIYEKTSMYSQAVGHLWGMADQEIRSADSLIVFGYSFPEADFAARTLLRSAFHHNSQLDSVSVIDISPDVAARISTILRPQTMRHYRTVPAFAADWK
jgi:hypothetical protein